MRSCSTLLGGCRLLTLLLAAWLPARLVGAQAPVWTGVTPGSLTQPSGTSVAQAAAPDASGNVLVVGYFSGAVYFGSTRLVSAGGQDWFIGKWLPATGTWAWVQRGGGADNDVARGVAVGSGSFYVVGSASNNASNANAVSFGPGNVQAGVGRTSSADLVLVKFVDQGAGAGVTWSQVAGGTDSDQGTDVAVSGSSVYVTGGFYNTRDNAQSVVFGGSGTVAGTVPQYGASTTNSLDLVLAKYTDNGATATFRWSQVGGGTGTDQGAAVAVSGSSVYVTGGLTNTRANAQAVVFGGAGTVAGTAPQYGASTASGTAAFPALDLVLAKYTDNGATATLGWTQVGGGTGSDQGLDLAVSGSSVYVAGYIANTRTNFNAVLLGGSGTVAGTVPQYGASTASSADVFLAKYTDAGSSASVTWSQVAGGTEGDLAARVALSDGTLYLSGYLSNSSTNADAVVFGGGGTTAGTATQLGLHPNANADLLVARYTDNGPTASFNWSQVGGGDTADLGLALAVSGSTVFVAGYMATNRSAFFGTAVGSPVVGSAPTRGVFAQLSSTAAAGTWQVVAASGVGGNSNARASALDAQGNLFVTGSFTGQVAFGTTVLSSGSDQDIFLAKYVPATNTWAWAQSAGGSGDDYGAGVAVSGGSVYLVGTISSNSADRLGVRFGGTGPSTRTAVQYGAAAASTTATSSDIVVAKYTDNGTSGAFQWSQVAGGTDADYGYGIAASGSSVYVAGTLRNNTANASAVLLGGSGSTLGTAVQYGASATTSADLVLLKYLDQGSSASLGWSQVGGGTGEDGAGAVAVSGSSVYLTGSIVSDPTNSRQVVFGGSGTAPGTSPQAGNQGGIGSIGYPDMVLAKYTDNGATATLGWTQAAGGLYSDSGTGLAVSGNRVFVTGSLSALATNAGTVNSGAAVFGGSGLTPGTILQNGASSAFGPDLFVAKYLDNGSTASVAWTQVGGGTDTDAGRALAVQGNSVFVVGTLLNNAANSNAVVFGTTGTTAGTAPQPGASATTSADVVVARYTDRGTLASFDWSQVGGGEYSEMVGGVAVTNTGLYVVGSAMLPSAFGSFALEGYYPTAGAYVASLGATVLPTRAASSPAGAGLALYPNPAPGGTARLSGTAPGAVVQVLDALGRRVATTTADATGTAALALPRALAPGVYVVRAGNQALRLTVE